MVVTPHVEVTEGLQDKVTPERVTPAALNPVGVAGAPSAHTEDLEELLEDIDVDVEDDSDDLDVLSDEDDLDVLTEEGTDDLLDEDLTSLDEPEPLLGFPQT